MEKTLSQIESLKNELENKEESEVTLNMTKKVNNELIDNFENMNIILEKKVNEKMEYFENNLEEKAKLIDSLKEAMDYCNDTFSEQFGIQIYPKLYCPKCKQKIRVNNDLRLHQHMENVHRVFKCHLCDFCSESKHGRRMHIKEDHT